ncbi:TRAP transporter small permease [Aquibium carbonis]|uniref:TRAP transporter small permease protein n=1 Tax=Aquibium carbonis TaxID=2495581 RepID=A0A429YQZ2_9HYPH|nr:TRAP transporter small permease [Aquibium carbonis]RST83887.1 TRAP transporter small permease [Aquibium carbonis]
MLKRFNDLVTLAVETALGVGFLALIGTVALQVVARNLLGLPFIWTLDLAQLLFSWLVFVGAAVAFRRGAHYTVDLWPENSPRIDRVLQAISLLGAVVVVFVLLRYGWNLTRIRWSGSVQSLGISRGWMFVPIPLSGALMLLFLIEFLSGVLRRREA